MSTIDKISLKNAQGTRVEYDIKDSTARRLATTTQTGQVKPDGETVTIDADGTIHAEGGGGADALDDLTDVELTSPAEGDLLQYNSTSGEWENSNAVPQKVAELQNTFTKQGNIADVESTSTSSKAYAVGDFLYYEGVLYKVTSAIAQGDSIVTSGSGQNVEVDTVSDELNEIQNQIAAVRDNGAVNKAGPVTIQTQAVSGLTITRNSDDTVTISGVYGGANRLDLDYVDRYTFALGAGTYRLTGCPSGYSNVELIMQVDGLWAKTGQTDYGNGCTFTATTSVNALAIRIQPGADFSTPAIFKPMISDAALNLSYDDYHPYSMTNRELTEEVTVEDITSKLNIYTDNFTIYALSAQRCGHIHNINFQLVAVNAGSADAGIDAIAFDDSVMPDSNTTLFQGWHMSSQSKYKGIFNVLRRTGRIAIVPSVAVSVGDYFNCSFMYMKK